MDPNRFDGLARLLAQPASRRRTLGVVVGGALATMAGVSASDAKRRHRHGHKRGKGSNSACAKFCAAVFGADTPAAAQCTSDAAHNNPASLCAICQADISNLCGTTCCTGTDTCGGGGTPGVCGHGGSSLTCNSDLGPTQLSPSSTPGATPVCPAGQGCNNHTCICSIGDCTTVTETSTECGGFFTRACQTASNGLTCCCFPNASDPSTADHCALTDGASGPNRSCCSGYCVQVPGETFGLCGPQPTT